MIFTETPLADAYLINIESIKDKRGFFATAFCEQQFFDHNLETRFPYSNISFNYERATLRGMHWQASPHQEIKLIRCVRGSIYDVIIDLRKKSKTYGKWFGVYLTDTNYTALYIPEDFAHGYLTMERSCTVLYQVSEPYSKQAERGFMWNDPEFGVCWPIEPKIISERDQNHPKFIRGLNYD